MTRLHATPAARLSTLAPFGTFGLALLLLALFAATTLGFTSNFGPLESTTNGVSTQTVVLPVDPSVTSDATLDLTLYGDLDAPNENLTVTIDGVTVGVVNGQQCQVFPQSLNIAAATLAPLAADGSITLAFTSTVGVNNGCPPAGPFTANGLAFAVQGTLNYTSAPPSWTLSSSASPTTFTAAGQNIGITYTLTNTGGVAISAIALAGIKTGTITCQATSLAAGASTTCSSTYTTVANDVGASIAFSAAATGTPAAGTVPDATTNGAISFAGQPALSLSMTSSPNSFERAAQPIAYQYTVTNSGNVDVTSIAIADSRAASVVCAVSSLTAGGSTSCTSTYTTSEDDVRGGHVVSTATASAVFSGTAVASAPVTLDVLLDGEAVRRATQSAIRNFMNQRADMVSTSTPDLSAMHDRLTGSLFSASAGEPTGVAVDIHAGNGRDRAADARTRSTAGLPFQFSGTGDHLAGRFSFAVSRAQILRSRASQGSAGRSGNAATGAPVAWNVWTEGSASWFEFGRDELERDATGGVVYAGFDRRLTSAVLIGGLVQFDWLSEDSGALELDARGNGWMAGPYVSMRGGPHLFLDARAAWGTSSNEVDPIGAYVDEFSTRRALVSGKVTGRWMHGRIRSRPNAEVIYFRETQNDYTGGTNILIPEQSISLGRLSFGPEFAYALGTHARLEWEPFVGINGLWDFAKTADTTSTLTDLDRDRFRARIEVGTAARSASGLGLGAAFAYDGLGSGVYRAYRGRVWVNVPIK